MRTFTVFRCEGCDHRVFPRRLACAHCGSSDWVEIEAAAGVVEEITTRRHRTYEEKRVLVGDWDERLPVRLAAVRTDAGPVVTARLEQELAPGARVRLGLSSGAPFAEAEPA